MYGKVHSSFFRSSINDTAPMVRFIFIGMIVLSDKDGKLDITRSALARELNVPPAEIDSAIDILGAPDPLSRSAVQEGRRIVPLDPARSWGWLVVNKEQYRGTADPETAREQTRERVRRFRNKEKNPRSNTDTDTGETLRNAGNGDVTQKALRAWFEEDWNDYPRKAGKKAAWDHYRVSVTSQADRAQLCVHLANYKARIVAERTTEKYILNGSTWFNNWRDEVYATAPAGQCIAARRPEGIAGVAL